MSRHGWITLITTLICIAVLAALVAMQTQKQELASESNRWGLAPCERSLNYAGGWLRQANHQDIPLSYSSGEVQSVLFHRDGRMYRLVIQNQATGVSDTLYNFGSNEAPGDLEDVSVCYYEVDGTCGSCHNSKIVDIHPK